MWNFFVNIGSALCFLTPPPPILPTKQPGQKNSVAAIATEREVVIQAIAKQILAHHNRFFHSQLSPHISVGLQRYAIIISHYTSWRKVEQELNHIKAQGPDGAINEWAKKWTGIISQVRADYIEIQDILTLYKKTEDAGIVPDEASLAKFKKQITEKQEVALNYLDASYAELDRKILSQEVVRNPDCARIIHSLETHRHSLRVVFTHVKQLPFDQDATIAEVVLYAPPIHDATQKITDATVAIFLAEETKIGTRPHKGGQICSMESVALLPPLYTRSSHNRTTKGKWVEEAVDRVNTLLLKPGVP